ncbi:ATP-binding protein [Nocardioides lianchengensis]|uniref:Sensor-like histidine kinase SenX3 n=1 Tax=Nocardioides lianchengensis TaxID=1045774 RepID=A0A1G6YKA6_9ACTN|nr:ATP-binding protein [Nocardioides lianchengensis]NYG09609.1 signal transduction histidine kinase [Nocardioides lianchengensis]SDD90944.1 His Kinase A (phospho-acceptor) domain-containing protein [Nocardioides lianchengensis]
MTSGRVRSSAVAVGCAVLYVAAGLLGRALLVEGTSLSLVWPAAGLPLLWFLLRRVRVRSIDVPLLAVAAATVLALTGTGGPETALVTATTVGQTLLAAALLRRWCPDLYGAGGTRPLDNPRMLALLVAAIALAMAAGAGVGTLGLAVLGRDPEPVTLALWFGRNLCGALVVTAPGLLVAERLARPRPRPPVLAGGSGGPAELVVASIFTIVVHAVTFGFGELSLAFVLVAATVWFGTRFPTLVLAVQTGLTGIVVVVATLDDIGPFVAVDEPGVPALLAQLYVVSTIVIGLALATGRDESRRLTDELRTAEADAVYQARLLDAVVATIDSGIAVVDDVGEIRFRNEAAAAVIGDGPALGSEGEVASRLRDAVRRALGGDLVRGLELVVGTDGEQILEVSATPLPRDGRRDRGRVLVLFRDATTEHDQRVELLAFAGVVAHDLRNPLAAIEGWTDLIDEHLERDELELDLSRQFVARVRSSSARMRDLIDDLLAHAESRDRELKVVPVDLAAVVGEVARARGADEQISCRGAVPSVCVDPVLVRQLLDNLLGNALKYVAPGTVPAIEVSGEREGDLVRVAVADNGIGLPAGEHELVFTEFHRAHHREYDGSGLGLAICRRIVTRHGGTIRAYDNPAGRGTVFEMTLPGA